MLKTYYMSTNLPLITTVLLTLPVMVLLFRISPLGGFCTRVFRVMAFIQSISTTAIHPLQSPQQHSLLLKFGTGGLGIPPFSHFKGLIKALLFLILKINLFFCNECQLGCSHKQPFQLSSSITSTPLALLHMDIWGTCNVTSVDGSLYYAAIIDDYSKYCWLFPLALKSDFKHTFISFVNQIETFLQFPVKIISTDGGCEFFNNYLKDFLTSKGILHECTFPHTPEQNGVAESKHKHILNLSRTLLLQSGLPHSYWVYAFNSANFLINRLPAKSISFNTPLEVLFNVKPDYNFLKCFGCACFPWLRPYTSSKLQPRSKHCVFLGYSSFQKGYQCLDPSTGKISISRHVVFDESSFPFKDLALSNSSIVLTDQFLSLKDSDSDSYSSVQTSSLETSTCPVSPIHSVQESTSSVSNDSIPLPSITTNAQNMITRAKKGIFKPKTYYASQHVLPSAFLRNVADPTPTCFSQENKKLVWRVSMADEINVHILAGTWSLVAPHSSQNVVGCKWVFRVKHKADGSIDKYKSRLVAKGFHQQ